MNPIVLISTHNRLDITLKNIKLLKEQSIKPEIVIVCSDSTEFNEFKKTGCHVIKTTNTPLGRKWQFGVDFCKDANPLIITGSDDILGSGFIENACRLINAGNHFIGLRSWYQHKDGKAYYCRYMVGNMFPLGGGRVYSNEMLTKIKHRIFDTVRDRHLDDFGWKNAKNSGLKCLVLENPEKEGLSIHAIKGDWKCLNPFTINHKNLLHIRTEPGKRVLPSFYEF